MKVVLFGATGMVGQGVLRECLDDDGVADVLAVGRRPVGAEHPKLRQMVHEDLAELVDLPDTKAELSGYDACFFCLGLSSVGAREEEYQRVTYDLTLTVARALAAWNQGLTFVYMSVMGADSSERSKTMSARIKGRTENALLALPMDAYMFRPGYIHPMPGVALKSRRQGALVAAGAPLYRVVRRLAPNQVTTTEQVGRAMIEIARSGAPRRILQTRDINSAAASA